MDPLLCDRGCPEASRVLNSLILHSKHYHESYECEYYYYFYHQEEETEAHRQEVP